MGGNRKHRWKFSFHRSSSNSKLDLKQPPKEFTCPISGVLMSDPVVVASGQTFERVAVQVCKDLNFSPKLEDGSRPDFSAIISNNAFKRTMIHWCDQSGTEHPHAPDYSSVERVVRAAMASQPDIKASERELLEGVADNPAVIYSHAATELGRRVTHFNSSSSEESVIIAASPGTPLPLTIRPTCYSSASSSSEITETDIQNPSGPASEEEEKLVAKFRSEEVFEQEEAVVSLRSMTRSRDDSRVSLCSPRLLSALRPLIVSRYSVVQVNAVASLVNLSLEKSNKVKIVRSGFIPFLIDVLKGGFPESQEHAAGALFSLALDDDNKIAIGVLGALQPLMHALRSESERTQHDSALALYHLTLVQSNRVKLVKLGAVPTLLTMVRSGKSASRVLLILCNLAVCNEGRTSMLDSNAVECLVGLLRSRELESEATRENCVAALYALSHARLRFKGLAKEARAVEVLKEIEERGTERAREKAKRLLQMMRAAGEGEDDDGIDFDGISGTGGLNRNRFRVGGGRSVKLYFNARLEGQKTMEKRRKRKRVELEGESKLKSSNKTGETTIGASNNSEVREPYPDHGPPTPEECRAVRDSLLAEHGFPQEFAKYRRQTTEDGVKSKPFDDAQESVLDGLVRTVLSQNTTDANSQRAFASLKSSFPNWQDVLNADSKDVQNAIRCGGLAPTKASCIKNVLSCLLEKRGKLCLEYLRDLSVDEIKSELSLFKGIGPKTVACVLMFNLQRDDFPVDTHIFEIARAMGWVPAAADRNKTYLHLNQRIPDELKFDLNCLLFTHGKLCRRCTSKKGNRQKEKCCHNSCPLLSYCKDPV
ncbi:hypothetical protein L6164_011093 [Bauhinia variegata]|uniref:Uncharacterized protein n=1 Tax=Bauhinia variegata TaxID=167791 RepID=A0ACB9P4Q8_BAUVA|nr:hypothetical protein L6164_011093 [Bauhinia variegata]